MEKLSNVKAVFFDLYNTLARFSPPREEIQAEACSAFGYTVTPEGIGRGYLKADAFMAAENARTHVQTRPTEEQRAFFAEYQRLVLEGAGVDVPPTIAASIWERVREIPYDMALFNDVADALPRIRSAGYKTGIISNMNKSGRQLTQEMGLDAYADFVVTSGDVGQGKPHPPIYLAALARANVDSTQAIHVGDSISADVEGAMAAGIRPVFMNRYLEVAQDEAVPDGVPIVHSLADVESLLVL
jgi:putative hydrolase of the HAD superfamily